MRLMAIGGLTTYVATYVAKLWDCEGTVPFCTLVTRPLGYFLKHPSTNRWIASVLSVLRTRRSRCHCHLQRLAPDLAQELLPALDAAAHQRAQQDRSIVIERRAEHGRDREDDVTIDAPLVEDLAHLADPVVHRDFGAAQAQRRLTAHRHQVLPLAPVQAAVCNRAHLLRVATSEHLGHQAIIVGCLVARMGMCELLPVLGTDLLEDVLVPRGCCK